MASSRAVRILAIIPGDGNGSSFIFARRQVESLKALGFDVDLHFFDGRLSVRKVLKNCRQIRSLVRQCQPDVIHIHYGTMTAFATTFSTSGPFVITFRGSDLQPEPGIGRLRVLVGRVLSQLSALRASRVVCVSDGLKRRLWWHRDRAIVLPTGVDLDRFKPEDVTLARKTLGWDLDHPVVLFNAGRAPITKGLDIAEAAIAEAMASYGPIRFVVMRGDVPPEKVPTFMNAADCLLVTSRTEASPGIVKEALACNLPIVSVDVGDVAERLKGVSLSCVVGRHPSNLAEALVNILREKRRSNGREHIADLSETHVAERLGSMFKALCANLGPTP